MRTDDSIGAQAVLAVGIGLALVALQIVQASNESLAGWLLFLFAALTAAIAAVGRGRSPAADAEPAGARGGGPQLQLTAVGIVCSLSAVLLSVADRLPILALGLWMAGIFGVWFATRDWTVSPPQPRAPDASATLRAALVGVLIVAALARFLWIDSVPPYYFGDEPRVGLYLKNQALKGIPSFFSLGWNTWPALGLYLQGLFTPLAGLNVVALRLMSAVIGTLTVLVTYLLARELFGARLALLTAAMLAIGRTAVDFSRLGICHAQVPFYETLAFYCWWRATKTGRAGTYILAGAALGLCLHTYNAGQLAPVLWAAWVVLGAMCAPRTIPRYWRGVALTLAGFLLATLPLWFHVTDVFRFKDEWIQWTYMSRDRQTMTIILDKWRTDGSDAALRILWDQVWRTWAGFTVLPAEAYRLGYRGGGMLDQISGPLFIVGLGIAAARVLRAPYAFILLWWLVTAIAGGVFTNGPPAYVRLVGLLPALAMLTALPLEGLLAAAATGTRRMVAIGVVALLLLGATADGAYTYFVRFAQDESDPMSELGYAVGRFPGNGPVAILGPEHFQHFTQEEIFALQYSDRRLIDVAETPHFLPIHEPLTGPLGLILGPTQMTMAPYLQSLYPSIAIADIVRGRDQKLILRTASIPLDVMQGRTGLSVPRADGAAPRIADPFTDSTTVAPPGTPIAWTGTVYWPTSKPVDLEIVAESPVTVKIADHTASAAKDNPTRTPLELPRGWLPITIEETATAQPRRLSLRVTGTSGPKTLTRWDLRPDGAGQGLRAEYTRDGQIVDRTIDPLIDHYAIEGFYEPVSPAPKSPFSVTWRGTLLVEEPGGYHFETEATGPNRVLLDGDTLVNAPTVSAEELKITGGDRELARGPHAIEAFLDDTHLSHTTRRTFQLFWTPPGGARELIPPSRWSWSTSAPAPAVAAPVARPKRVK